MKRQAISGLKLALAFALIAGFCTSLARTQEKPPAQLVMTKILVTVEGDKDKQPPELKREDVVAKIVKERIPVKHWEAAKGQYADLALFILIDDVLDPSTGGLFGDIREFIKAQPPTTLIGIVYMRNGTVSVAQDLTNDHEAAAKALRLPVGHAGTYGNPYLSFTSLIKKWPDHGGRKKS